MRSSARQRRRAESQMTCPAESKLGAAESYFVLFKRTFHAGKQFWIPHGMSERTTWHISVPAMRCITAFDQRM